MRDRDKVGVVSTRGGDKVVGVGGNNKIGILRTGDGDGATSDSNKMRAFKIIVGGCIKWV